MWTAVNFLGNKYGIVAYTTYTQLEDGVYGRASGNQIMFNSTYVFNPQLLRDDLTNDVINGYHRGVNCTPEQWVAAHEFAHVLDFTRGFEARTELVVALDNGLTGQVSGYSVDDEGYVNIPEALAEAFTAVECDTPTPAEVALYEMLVY